MANLQSISAKQISVVLDVSRALAVVLELESLLPEIARAACEVLACQRSSVWLHYPSERKLRTRVALGTGEITVDDDSGIVGAAFKQNKVLNIPNPYDDPRFNRTADVRGGFVTQSLLTAPMLDLRAQPVGVIQAVNKKGGAFNESDEALIRLLADQAAVAIQRQLLHRAATDAEVMRREMNLARSIQLALIPASAPIVPGITAAGWTTPASIAGGDCYDLWRLEDGRLALLVADATGHGIGPAMVVSQVRTMARLLCERPSIHRLDPTDVLTQINRRLAVDLVPGQFVTAFLAFVDGSGLIHWSSAGHGPSLVRRSPQAAIESLASNGVPLGILPECFENCDPPPPIQLEPGGMLLAMSDGIFEAFDTMGDQFGVERVTELAAQPMASPTQLIEELKHAVSAWTTLPDPTDDQTLVVVQRDRTP